MEITFRKLTHFFVYLLIPLVLFLLSVFSSDGEFFSELGNFALYTLIAVMFIKPLYVLIPWKFLRELGTYRREIGLLSFWFFIFHAGGLIYERNLFSLSDYYGSGNFLFWGMVAAVCLVLTGITSNKFSVRVLKGNWKRVQYLAYLAFIAALIHAGLVERGDDFVGYLVIAVLYVMLKAAEFWKMRRDERAEVLPQ